MFHFRNDRVPGWGMKLVNLESSLFVSRLSPVQQLAHLGTYEGMRRGSRAKIFTSSP